MERVLRKKDVQKGFYHPLLGIDVENNPDTGAFICGGIFGEIRKRTSVWRSGKSSVVYLRVPIELYFNNQDKFEKYFVSLKQNSCLLVFFNLSYDKYYLNDIIADLKINKDGTYDLPILHNGNRVIQVKLKNGLRAIDLCNHVDGSLESWINHLGMKAKYNVEKVSLKNLRSRVMNDCKATYYLGKFLQDFYYNECNIPFQVTVGASALRIFQQKFFTDFWYRDSDFLSEFERQSYYGGRTELFKKGTFKTYNYDVNSMYLSIMRDNLLPDVSSARYVQDGNNYLKHFNKYLGIYYCRVRSPKYLYIPVLPVRIEGKLKFPLGEFNGTWTSIELKKALELGYKIINVFNYIYYKQSKYYFTEFAKFVWGKRKEYKSKNNKGMDLMIKKIGNSLYGKFAQRNSNDYFGRITEIDKIPDVCEIFDVSGEIWVKIKGDLVPATFEFPAISSFITSYARLKLYSGIENNSENIIYCDTDSLKLSAPATNINIGNELGEYTFEGVHETEFFRPKFYDEKQPDKEHIFDNREVLKMGMGSVPYSLSGIKCKGVPKRAEIIERTRDYIKFKYKKPLREREAIRRHTLPNIWVDVIKLASFSDDKREWYGSESKPLKINIKNR